MLTYIEVNQLKAWSKHHNHYHIPWGKSSEFCCMLLHTEQEHQDQFFTGSRYKLCTTGNNK